MSNEIILNADLRIRTGTNKTREIRREDSMVPAIIYGNEEESKNIKLKLNELTKASENELFYTQVLKILLEGNEEKVVLKELQREPVKGKFLMQIFKEFLEKLSLRLWSHSDLMVKRNVRVLKRVAESLPKQFQK
jgi:large subunit ribosomal protein L25